MFKVVSFLSASPLRISASPSLKKLSPSEQTPIDTRTIRNRVFRFLEQSELQCHLDSCDETMECYLSYEQVSSSFSGKGKRRKSNASTLTVSYNTVSISNGASSNIYSGSILFIDSKLPSGEYSEPVIIKKSKPGINFAKEIAVYRRLQHKLTEYPLNFIRLIGVCEHPDGSSLMILSPCDEDLISFFNTPQNFNFFLEDPSLNLTSASFKYIYSSVIFQMYSLVKLLHAQNLLHLDIKFDNFFISYLDLESLSIRLGDFGLSVDKDASSTDLCGTLTTLDPIVILKHCRNQLVKKSKPLDLVPLYSEYSDFYSVISEMNHLFFHSPLLSVETVLESGVFNFKLGYKPFTDFQKASYPEVCRLLEDAVLVTYNELCSLRDSYFHPDRFKICFKAGAPSFRPVPSYSEFYESLSVRLEEICELSSKAAS